MKRLLRTLITFLALAAFLAQRSDGAAKKPVPLGGGVDSKRVEQISGMLDSQPFAFGPKIDDRAGWQRLAATKPFAKAVKDAEKLLTKPLPEMTEELYQQFKQTGRRTSDYRRARSERYGRIAKFTLAECVENKGRFIKPLESVLRSICGENTWIYNFHDGNLADYQGKQTTIDLGSADLAQNLGACLYLLDDRLSAGTRQQVMARLRERIFDPYHRAVEGTGRRQWWITGDNNWNAVCHAGVVAGALAVCPDRNERAFFVAAAEKYSLDFLRGFGGDGYCAEGMGYWNYGFGNYMQLCETIFQATKGGVDLYQLEGARDTALYPVRIRLINDLYPAYADCSLNSKPGRQLMGYINRRFELGLKEFAGAEELTKLGDLPGTLMFASPNSATARPLAKGRELYEIRSCFEHGGVLNCRPSPGSVCRMAVSLKGGHNSEPHNHNDLGSSVVVLGKEALILDPGGEIYTARTFSRHRYESKLLNSYGHPVPVIAGELQRSGSAAKAIPISKQFTDAADTYALDLRSGYQVPALRKLTRTFVYRRAGEGALTVTDDFAFSTPQTFGSALVTYGQWKQISARELRVERNQEAVKVVIDTGGVPFTVTSEVIKEETHDKKQPTRIGINLTGPQAKGRVTLTITPVAAK